MAVNRGFSQLSTQVWKFAISSRNSGKCLLNIYRSIIKGIIRSRDKEVHMVPSAGAPAPAELGWVILPACGCVHQPETVQTSSFRVFNGGVITLAQAIKSLEVVNWPKLWPLCFSRRLGLEVRGVWWGWKFLSSNLVVGSSGSQLPH